MGNRLPRRSMTFKEQIWGDEDIAASYLKATEQFSGHTISNPAPLGYPHDRIMPTPSQLSFLIWVLITPMKQDEPKPPEILEVYTPQIIISQKEYI